MAADTDDRGGANAGVIIAFVAVAALRDAIHRGADENAAWSAFVAQVAALMTFDVGNAPTVGLLRDIARQMSRHGRGDASCGT